MKRFLAVGMALLLVSALFSACKREENPTSEPGTEESVTASSETQDAAENGAPAKEAPLRTLLTWNGIQLSGPTVQALSGGFEYLTISGAKADSDSSAASLSFSLEKAEGALKLSGAVYLGKDASGLFDTDADEETDESADPNTLLFRMAEERITEGGGEVQKAESGGISWNYGFSEGDVNGASVLRLLAWSSLEGGILYVDLTASDLSGKELEEEKAALGEWLLKLTVKETSESTEGGLMIPFGDQSLLAEDMDFLRFYGTVLQWSAGEGYLDASYSGSTDDYDFYCTLKNSSAAGEETVDAALTSKDTLDSPLSWKTHLTEDTLVAAAGLEGDTFLFELSLEYPEDTENDAAFQTALDWLKSVSIQ